jgi:hypothetical protein
MKATRLLFVLINLLGMVFPFVFPLFPAGTTGYFGPLFSWPVFLFCIWGGLRGSIRYEDDGGGVWQLNVETRPSQYWWAMGLTSFAGWLFMLATRAGERMVG